MGKAHGAQVSGVYGGLLPYTITTVDKWPGLDAWAQQVKDATVQAVLTDGTAMDTLHFAAPCTACTDGHWHLGVVALWPPAAKAMPPGVWLLALRGALSQLLAQAQAQAAAVVMGGHAVPTTGDDAARILDTLGAYLQAAQDAPRVDLCGLWQVQRPVPDQPPGLVPMDALAAGGWASPLQGLLPPPATHVRETVYA